MVFHLESAAESYGWGGDQGVQVRDRSRPLLEREESVSPPTISFMIVWPVFLLLNIISCYCPSRFSS
jgi:hypothetical protein